MKFIARSLVLAIAFCATAIQAATSTPLPRRAAVVLATAGKLEVSLDGKTFHRAKKGEIFYEGAVFRTGRSGSADLFFRRIGTMVRLLPGSELELEKLQRKEGEKGISVNETILSLHKGRVFTFVRVLFPESTFQVRTEKGLATLKGSGTGRYDIAANGRFVTGKSSRSSLKVIVEGEERIIAPGELFNIRDKKVTPLAPSESESLLLEMDELQRLAEVLAPDLTPGEMEKR